jgi:hypothetical protein
MAIWMTQCLCEHRHILVAGVYDDAKYRTPREGADATQADIERMLAIGEWERQCRICLSELTKYKTVEEARPALQNAMAVGRCCEAGRSGSPGNALIDG